MTTAPGLVVVGGSIAGVRAVEGARAAGYTGSITLITTETHLPYDRPPLSKDLLAPNGTLEPPTLRDEAAWDELGANVRTGVTATGLDPVTRVVHTSAGDVPYSSLVITTGGEARRLPGALTMRSYADAKYVRSALDNARRVLVVGAGFIGAEVATAARARNLEVIVIDAAPLPLGRAVGDIGGEALVAVHRAGGVDLRLGTTIVAQGPGGVTLSDGTSIRPDTVIAGIGAGPATSWLAGSGIALHDPTGAVVAATTLATNLPDVWVAGDAAIIDGELGQHWVAAADQGRIAGMNAVSPEPQVWSGVAFAWSHWYGHRIQYVGECRGDEDVFLAGESVSGVILTRAGDRFAGALAIDGPGDAAKARRLIAAGTSWADALESYSAVPSLVE
ncbi:putative ferredoxin reductase [Nocardioides baekrokdamisoli]|uniref:Putative ferredoxin reductase n=1 Tax=Nocardioides baekrokdamisoli TaxID=1804624 RepID=A0A3G9IZI3_9ACTN|nr:FAD-dependent oxidoreductase [Nocardioides baekrokdamisoli]BBH16109.1 putative ferredoxin reductase [Nocardioides baekrokdamisoli]